MMKQKTPKSRDFFDFLKLYFDFITLGTLIVSVIVVIMYWKETQAMKQEMVIQNKINFQNIKLSNMPLIDLQFEKVKPSPPFFHKVQFAYDMFLINKGKGPAFNVSIKRSVDHSKMDRSSPSDSGGRVGSFSRRVDIIGVGEKIKVYREHSDSYKDIKIVITCRGYFWEFHEFVFEGNRDGVKLKKYPLLKSPL